MTPVVNGARPVRRIVHVDEGGWAHWEELDPVSGRVVCRGRTSRDGTLTYAIGAPPWAAPDPEEDEDDE